MTLDKLVVCLGVVLAGCFGGAGGGAPDAGQVVTVDDGGPGALPDAGAEETPDAGPGELPDGGGTDGGMELPPPQPGAALLFQPTARIVLADTRNPPEVRCGTFAPVEGGNRRLTIDFDQCAFDGAVPDEAVGLAGSVTVDLYSDETVDVRIQASDALVPGAPNTVGPLQTSTHGFVTALGADRAFVIDVPGTGSADVRIEMTAALVPQSAGGDYMHLLNQPLRWFASNPNDDGFRAVWPRIESVLRYPVVGADQDATAMFGAVHLGPGVWRSERVTFHMGAAGSATSAHDLPRWSSIPVDGHFPWRYSSFFLTAASNSQEIELRASAEQDPFDTGIEPWVDAVGFLSPNPGLVYRPLNRPVGFAPGIHVNDEDVLFDTGLTNIEGVMGTITFDLPQWPFDEKNRWFFVMVAKDPSAFPGALGGGLEGPDWMTAGLNQNGRVTVRFVSRTTPSGRFVMRHYAYLAGGPNPDPRYFDVTVQVRVDAVLTRP